MRPEREESLVDQQRKLRRWKLQFSRVRLLRSVQIRRQLHPPRFHLPKPHGSLCGAGQEPSECPHPLNPSVNASYVSRQHTFYRFKNAISHHLLQVRNHVSIGPLINFTLHAMHHGANDSEKSLELRLGAAGADYFSPVTASRMLYKFIGALFFAELHETVENYTIDLYYNTSIGFVEPDDKSFWHQPDADEKYSDLLMEKLRKVVFVDVEEDIATAPVKWMIGLAALSITVVVIACVLVLRHKNGWQLRRPIAVNYEVFENKVNIGTA